MGTESKSYSELISEERNRIEQEIQRQKETVLKTIGKFRKLSSISVKKFSGVYRGDKTKTMLLLFAGFYN